MKIETSQQQVATKRTMMLSNRASLAALVLAAYCLLCASADKHLATANEQRPEDQKATIEAELNTIMQQHGGQLDASNGKPLAEAIISRFMVDNLTGSGLTGNSDAEADLESFESQPINLNNGLFADQQSASSSEFGPIPLTGPTGPEAMKLKKLVSLLRNYENMSNLGLNGGQAFEQYPVLPSGQAATMKRAAAKIGAYLQQQQQQQQLQQPRLGYARNNFDFGLGKRPDLSPSTVLRMGDLGGSEPGQATSISQYGKRPAAGHRFDFGLGKRVSQNYQRFDFGLGKRAPHGLRYDFGLGKKK